MKRIVRFVVAGGIGFLVDAGSLTLFVNLTPLDPFIARIVSIAIAMVATWLFNRTITFGRSQHSTASEATRYGTVAIVTSLTNYAIYSGTMLLWPSLWPAIAVAVATTFTMFMSYFGYSKLVFGSSTKSSAKPED